MRPSCCLSDLVREIKKSSNKFVNGIQLPQSRFQWQEGYGAFSYSHSALDNVIAYINNQKEHHKKRTFKEEYLTSLRKNEIEFEEAYVFKWIE
jgi:hypothetical protein